MITVDQLIELLQAGKDNGVWTGDLPVKISAEFPYHLFAHRVARPEQGISDTGCVTLYAAGAL